jgi:hypothetical protein
LPNQERTTGWTCIALFEWFQTNVHPVVSGEYRNVYACFSGNEMHVIVAKTAVASGRVNIIAGKTFQSMRNGTSPAEHHLLMHLTCYLSNDHTIPPLLVDFFLLATSFIEGAFFKLK